MIFALTGIGVTILSTVEVDESFTEFPFSTYSISFLCDDIIRLRYVSIDGQLRKIMVVIKMRGGNHAKDIREYEITSKGVVILDQRLTNYQGLISGIPVHSNRSTQEVQSSHDSGNQESDLRNHLRIRRSGRRTSPRLGTRCFGPRALDFEHFATADGCIGGTRSHPALRQSCLLSAGLKTKDELSGSASTRSCGWAGCLRLLDHVYSTGEVIIQTEPERTEAHSARWSYTMWPVRGAEDHPVGVMMQVTETTQFHQQAIAVNEQLLLSGVRQHELRENAERLNAQLQLEITDRKRMERPWSIARKLAVTARFASTMAHEINNPLEAMTNLVYLLAPLQTSPEARALHRHARRSVAGSASHCCTCAQVSPRWQQACRIQFECGAPRSIRLLSAAG